MIFVTAHGFRNDCHYNFVYQQHRICCDRLVDILNNMHRGINYVRVRPIIRRISSPIDNVATKAENDKSDMGIMLWKRGGDEDVGRG
jgi:hypothetical protein